MNLLVSQERLEDLQELENVPRNDDNRQQTEVSLIRHINANAASLNYVLLRILKFA